MVAIPSMFAKTSVVLPFLFRNITRICHSGQNPVIGCDTAHNTEWDILEEFRGVEKLMTSCLHQTVKTAIITRGEYQRREMTLKY